MKKLSKVILSFVFVVCSMFSVHAEESVRMWRLYNPNSGEHFYTASESERDSVYNAGWNIEGYGWVSPTGSNIPVYRVYNPNAGDHHYTVSEEEKNKLVAVGWRDEGIGWYASATGIPVYREYNPNAVTGAHNFTTSKAEHDQLVALGWRDEGIAFYVLGSGSDEGTREHWYGMSEESMNAAISVIGIQMDEKYGAKSYTMCSVYAMADLRYALFGDAREPATYWRDNGGAIWSSGGGTDHRGVDVLAVARQNISAGRPVIIHTPNHYVVAFAYKGAGVNLSDYKVLDPAIGWINRLSAYGLQGDGQIITF